MTKIAFAVAVAASAVALALGLWPLHITPLGGGVEVSCGSAFQARSIDDNVINDDIAGLCEGNIATQQNRVWVAGAVGIGAAVIGVVLLVLQALGWIVGAGVRGGARAAGRASSKRRQRTGPVPVPQPAAVTPAFVSSGPAAWFPDPYGRHELRWWDGANWTNHVQNQGAPGTGSAVLDGESRPPRERI
jgi:Protein of unknown function (DUF2510)